MALDLKYRPKKFADILGNKAVVQLLHQLSRSGKLGERSLMFGGPKGCGKTSLARIVACAVVCNDLQDGEPCGVCNSCLGVRQESAESFEEFDAATQGSVEHMRTIVSELDYGNLNGKPSVFILDEAQRLTKQAQDALLKSIEDRRMLVILCTTEPHKIQGPLRDRMTEFPVAAPAPDMLLGHLHYVCKAESIQAPDDALRLIIQAQNNCPRTCLTALEMLSSAGPISVEDVKTYFRLGATEKLVVALEGLSSDPKVALSTISDLLDSEGPSWVRDTVIQVVTSAVRASVGAKPTIAVPTSLYATRGPVWLAVAKALGQIDKPSAADVEAILLEAIPNLPIATAPLPADWEKRLSAPLPPPVLVSSGPPASPPAPVQVTPEPPQALSPGPSPRPPEPKPEIKAEPSRRIVQPKQKILEIDGVSFSPTEKLTSVDEKLEKGSRGAPIATGPTSAPDVRLDKDLHPMAPKEFARGFLQRIKGQE
jgi:DNA polymerase-3 subunit gamma/tau